MHKNIVKEHKQFEKEEELLDYLINILNKDEKTILFIKKRIAKFGFESVKSLSFRDTFYNKPDENVTIYCFNCKKDYKVRPSNFLSRKANGCKYCSVKKANNSKHIINKVKFNNKKPQLEKELHLDLSDADFIDNTTLLKVKCTDCGKTFSIRPNKLFCGHRCESCANLERNRKKKEKYGRLFFEKASITHNGKYGYDHFEYINAKTPSDITCFNCDRDFPQTPDKHLRGQGCPYCNMSKGEICTDEFLARVNLRNTPQKTFEECKNIRKLPFDFYLDDYNILIEYDGEPHFKEMRYSKDSSINKKKLEERIKLDNIKTNFAKDTNRHLIRIPFGGSNKLEDIRKNVYETLYRELPKYIKDFTPIDISTSL